MAAPLRRLSRSSRWEVTLPFRSSTENAVQILPAFASHHSSPGVVVLPLADAEVTWKILVMWRRGTAGGALKALLDALFTKVTPKAKEAKSQLPKPSLRAANPIPSPPSF